VLVTVAAFGAFNVVVSLLGFAYMHRALREMQRMTRAVAGLVYQESEKIRELLRDGP
jgi:hypothetical protein